MAGMPDDDHDDRDEDDERWEQDLWFARNAAMQQLPDGLLMILAEMVANDTISLDITLFMGGTIVAGMWVSPPQWLNEVSEDMKGSPGADGLAAGVRTLAMEIQTETALAAADGKRDSARHICLIDAEFLMGGRPSGRGMKWRGRLGSVDGYALGRAFSS